MRRAGGGIVSVPAHGADVGAVDMDADGGAVGERVRYLVDVADARRDEVDAAGRQRVAARRAEPAGRGITHEFLAQLRAAHDADHAPHRVVVHRRGLARSPDEAHYREALQRVAIQQVLLIALRARLGEIVGQPVVVAHELREELLAFVEDALLVAAGLLDQAGEGLNEIAQARGLAHGRFSLRSLPKVRREAA